MDTIHAHAHSVLVLDSMEFRRQGIAGTVENWAHSIDADLVTFAPSELPGVPEVGEVTLVIISLGATSIAAPNVATWLNDIHRLAPGAPIAVLSDIETAEEASAVIHAGLQGLLPTSLRPSIVLHAFAFIRSGGTYFPPALLLPAYEAMTQQSAAKGPTDEAAIQVGEIAGLTHRQSDVLALLRQGRSNKLIARALDMQESTVKVHVRQIMRKMGAANRTQAALMAAGSSVQRPLAGRPFGSPPAVTAAVTSLATTSV